jgi:hypothetical protein
MFMSPPSPGNKTGYIPIAIFSSTNPGPKHRLFRLLFSSALIRFFAFLLRRPRVRAVVFAALLRYSPRCLTICQHAGLTWNCLRLFSQHSGLLPG